MRDTSTGLILKTLHANSRLFFLLRGGRRRLFRPLLELLETHEIAYLALSLAGKLLVLPDEPPGLLGARVFHLAEEFSHFQVEDLEDLEERVEADFVLALLHPGEIGLRDADLLRE